MRAFQLTVGTVVAIAGTNNKEFLSGNAVADLENQIPNEVVELSKEIIDTADGNGDHAVSAQELNQGVDSAAEALQASLSQASGVFQEVSENIQKELPALSEQLAAQFPNLSMQDVQKKMEEMPNSSQKVQLQQMLAGLFGQLDENNDQSIDGQEVADQAGEVLKQVIGQSSDMIKQFQAQLPGLLAGFAQKAKTALAAVDRDQDGSITPEELASVIEESMEADEEDDEEEDVEDDEE